MARRYCTDKQVAANARAARRAKAQLRAGDRLYVSTCGGRGVTVTMVGWSDQFPDFIASKTLDGDEIHPINIRKVNGHLVNFSDPVLVHDSAAIAQNTDGGQGA